MTLGLKRITIFVVIFFLIGSIIPLIQIPNTSGNLINPSAAIELTGPKHMSGIQPTIAPLFAGGDGTVGSPYQISNVTELQWMGNTSNLDKHFILVNDINASVTKSWNGGWGYRPVGDIYNQFTGSLDGQDYNITDLFISRSSTRYVGLFGYLGSIGKVSNVSLLDNIVRGYDCVGGLVGHNSYGTVSSSFATGNVSGYRYVGGLAGMQGYSAIVNNCYATGNVSGNGYIGGLVGKNEYGTVKNSYTSSNVSGYEYVGGLVGRNEEGTMNNCYANGNVNGNSNVGGLVGRNEYGTVTNCYTTGNVSGTHWIGGLVGCNYGTVNNSYATGNLSGGGGGGLVGCNYGTVNNSYVIGNVSGIRGVGGLVGLNFGTVTNSYTTGNVSGEESIGGLVGYEGDGTIVNSFYCINYTAVKDKHYVTPYGIYKTQFDDWLDNDKTIDIDDHLSKVSGTQYYNISSIIEFKTMLPFSTIAGYDFIQTSDIDLSSDIGFYFPILKGNYEGSNFFISNLNVSYYANLNIGMFGRNYGTIQNLRILDCNVWGEGSIGGLVGCNYGTVNNSYATGNVNGDSIVGGLVGYNELGTVNNSFAIGDVSGEGGIGGVVGSNHYGKVSNSYAISNVRGDSELGGLAGWNSGTVSNSFATGNVNGGEYVGGLVGYNVGGSFSNCYATGNVSGDQYVGGFVGFNYGTVSNSYATGTVSGVYAVGGLVGYNDDSTVSNSYETGNVSGGDCVGGLVGYNDDSTIDNCYSAGKVTGNTNFGGFCGNNTGTISKCFFDIQTSGMTTSEGGIGKNTIEMKYKITFTNSSWDFTKTWGILENCSYPFLKNFSFSLSIGEIVGSIINNVYEDDLLWIDYDIKVIETDLPGALPGVFDIPGPWALDTNTSFLTVNNNGVLNGTPRNEDVGIYFVNISVIDTAIIKNTKYTNFTLKVHNTNDVPYITSSPLYTAIEEEMIHYSVVAEDDDLNISVVEILTYNLDYAPNGMSIDPSTGLIQWVPTNTQACQNHTVIVNVTDNAKTFDTQEFIINVSNTNDAPVITSNAIKTAVEDEMYEYQLTTHDDDLLNPSSEHLTFSIVMAPKGLTIGSYSGLIQWLPTNDDVGVHLVNVTVSDLAHANNSQNFTLTVINVNDPPKISKIGGQSPPANRTIAMGKTTKGEYYNFTIKANDVDGDVLDCESNNNEASITNIGNNSWNISFSPSKEGEVTINFTVKDEIESDFIFLTWEVKTIPAIAIISKHSNKIEINDKIIIEGTWSDPDGDNVDEIWVKQQFSDQNKTDFYKVGYSEEDYNELSEEYRTGRILGGVFVWEYLSINTNGTWKYMFDTEIYNSAYVWYLQNLPNMMERFGLVTKVTKGDMIFTFKAIDENDLESDKQSIKVILEGDEVIDIDNDGLPDNWEILYFDDISNCSPNDDPDRDGKTNLDEYLAGTNPTVNDLIPEEHPEKPDDKPDEKEAEGLGILIGGIIILIIIIILVIVVIFLIMKKKKLFDKPEMDSQPTPEPPAPKPPMPLQTEQPPQEQQPHLIKDRASTAMAPGIDTSTTPTKTTTINTQVKVIPTPTGDTTLTTSSMQAKAQLPPAQVQSQPVESTKLETIRYQPRPRLLPPPQEPQPPMEG